MGSRVQYQVCLGLANAGQAGAFLRNGPVFGKIFDGTGLDCDQAGSAIARPAASLDLDALFFGELQQRAEAGIPAAAPTGTTERDFKGRGRACNQRLRSGLLDRRWAERFKENALIRDTP